MERYYYWQEQVSVGQFPTLQLALHQLSIPGLLSNGGMAWQFSEFCSIVESTEVAFVVFDADVVVITVGPVVVATWAFSGFKVVVIGMLMFCIPDPLMLMSAHPLKVSWGPHPRQQFSVFLSHPQLFAHVQCHWKIFELAIYKIQVCD